MHHLQYIRVWEYFALNFDIFPAGCLRICYSVRPQYWAKKDAISMETDRQSDPSARYVESTLGDFRNISTIFLHIFIGSITLQFLQF